MSKIERIVPQSNGTSLVYLDNGEVKKASLTRLKKHPIKVGDEYVKVEYDHTGIEPKKAPVLEKKEVEDIVVETEPVVEKPKKKRTKN